MEANHHNIEIEAERNDESVAIDQRERRLTNFWDNWLGNIIPTSQADEALKECYIWE